jgi:uncharacterized protein (DUF433 family)/DNA-binding transcriptional MerR regulator
MTELLGIGLYSPAEVSRLLRVPPATVRRWLLGYTYVVAGGTRRGAPAIGAGRGMERELGVVTFLDLVELLVVKGFRSRGVPLKHVRIAAEQAAELFHTDHPLATQRLQTDGRHIFARVQDARGFAGLVSLSERGQWVFPEAVEAYLQELDFDLDTHLAIRWWPAGKGRPVVLDPRVCFGRPHIAGTGVPTTALYGPVAAGDDPRLVAQWFRVDLSQVEAAVAYERELRAA